MRAIICALMVVFAGCTTGSVDRVGRIPVGPAIHLTEAELHLVDGDCLLHAQLPDGSDLWIHHVTHAACEVPK